MHKRRTIQAARGQGERRTKERRVTLAWLNHGEDAPRERERRKEKECLEEKSGQGREEEGEAWLGWTRGVLAWWTDEAREPTNATNPAEPQTNSTRWFNAKRGRGSPAPGTETGREKGQRGCGAQEGNAWGPASTAVMVGCWIVAGWLLAHPETTFASCRRPTRAPLPSRPINPPQDFLAILGYFHVWEPGVLRRC
jgi:hypothetical protein